MEAFRMEPNSEYNFFRGSSREKPRIAHINGTTDYTDEIDEDFLYIDRVLSIFIDQD